MPKSSPLQRPKVLHHGERNAFDLSRKALFTANPGQLIPFFCQEVQPGDHFEISENSFTRTMPCETAAYVRMKENREFFFVPYRYLWSYWEQFISQVNDFHSSLLYQNSGGKVPHWVPQLDLKQLLQTYVFNASESEDSYHGNKQDLAGTFYSTNFVKLFNLLGYGSLNVTYDNSFTAARKVNTDLESNFSNNLCPGESFALNPFRALCYNKIWFDYYRKSDWTPNVPQAYNIDSHDVVNQYITDDNIYKNLFVMRYRPWKVDYFTSVRPSTYWYGSAYEGSPQSGIDESSLVGLPRKFAGYLDGAVTGDPMVLNFSGDGVNPNAVRVMFALDKYLRTTQLAGKHYDDQILAHFGEKVNNDIAQETMLIGAFTIPLVISEVTATADTSTASVGQQFGKGTANGTSNSDVIKFDAHEHGIIMGIYSTSIESDYSATGIDAFNLKRDRTDYYTPELDAIGPHIITPEMVSSQVLKNQIGSRERLGVLGFIDPYLEYKLPVDKVFGDFMRGENLENWTASRQFGLDPSIVPHEVIYRQLNTSDLYIDPRVVDNIFGIYTALTECLLIDDYTIVDAVRNMSVHGSPSLN